MKTIEYARHGVVYPDAQCEESARSFLLREGDRETCAANELFITAVRVLIKEGLVPYTDVRFLFMGAYFLPEKDGSIASWPVGFCDTWDNFLTRLLS